MLVGEFKLILAHYIGLPYSQGQLGFCIGEKAPFTSYSCQVKSFECL
jgi:hypothetical protein